MNNYIRGQGHSRLAGEWASKEKGKSLVGERMQAGPVAVEKPKLCGKIKARLKEKARLPPTKCHGMGDWVRWR